MVHQRVQQRIPDIRAGKQPDSSLVVLDLEASWGFNQLWEIAIIELISGTPLLNTTIRHPGGLDHSNKNPTWAEGNKPRARRIFDKKRPGIEFLDVHLIAKRLKQQKFTTDTLVLVWHSNYQDLRLLRNFIEAGGEDVQVLPTLDNCVPLINQYRPKSRKS